LARHVEWREYVRENRVAMTHDVFSPFAVFAILGIFLMSTGVWLRFKETAPRAWPQAKGVIVGSRVLHGKHSRPEVEYEFTYQGHRYKSSHWRFGNYSTGSREYADAVAFRYSVGDAVDVFVNIKEPANSVLEHRPTLLSWSLIISGIVVPTIGLILALITLFAGKRF
jgi:hypothetical protein